MNVFRQLNKQRVRRKFVYEFLFLLQKLRSLFYRFMLSDNTALLGNTLLNQPTQFVGRGDIDIRGVSIGVWRSPHFLGGYAYLEAREASSRITIGEGTFLNNNASIIADRGAVEIGKRCLIGLNFSAVDSDFHGLELENRNNGNYECVDVYIGNDVFIGNNVTILKGVRIGDGAVIGNGSLVVNNVEPMTIHAGVPAKLIRAI